MTSRLKEHFNTLTPEISRFNIEEKEKFNLLESINKITLNGTNVKEEMKKKIEKLNIKFYQETDKFLNLKTEIDKSQDNLFLLLFKQISLYIEEVNRLNNKIKEKEDNDKISKNKNEVLLY